MCRIYYRQQRFEQLVLATIVNVEIGTKDFGISAGEGEISFTLRAALQRELDELEQMIRTQAEKFAAEEGLQLSYAYDDPFPEMQMMQRLSNG